jgi:hypothetical protein
LNDGKSVKTPVVVGFQLIHYYKPSVRTGNLSGL